jgi:hypothetical protein
MSRRQEAESTALRAENIRLRAKLAMRDRDINTPPCTNAINIAEKEIPPTASLVQRVNPDTV